MATVTSRIRIEIEAKLEGFRDATRGAIVQIRLMAAAVQENKKQFDAVGVGIGKFLRYVALVGAATSAVQFIVGLTASLSNLLPILALAPAAIFTLVAAVSTFKLATAGFADAVGGDAEAMAKLAPAARDTAKAVQALKPAFDDVRKAVQQEFFRNFASDVKVLGATYLPILRAQLPRIADGFNDMGRSITRALTTGSSANDINKALGKTADFLENARNAAGHLIAGLTPLIAFGSDYIPAIGTAIDGAADRFRAWSLRVTADGSLKGWVDGAIAEFKILQDLIGHVGTIFDEIFTGLSSGSGKDFLQTLDDAATALADFLGTAEAQTALQALGDAFRDISQVTRDVFLEALKQLAPIIIELSPVVAEIARVVGDLLVNALRIAGPLLTAVAGFLNDNKDAIADLAPLVIGLWAAFKGASILQTVIGFLGGPTGLIARLGGLSAVLRGGLIVAVGAFAIKLNDMNKAAAADEGRPLTDMEDNLDNLVGAFRELATLDFAGIFSDIGDEVDTVRQKFLDGTSPIGAFKDKLTEATVAAKNFVVDGGEAVKNFFTTELPASVGNVGKSIEQAFVDAATTVGNFFTVTIPGKVEEGFTAVKASITAKGADIGQGFSDAFETAKTAVVTKLTEIGTAVTDFFSQTPFEIGFALGAIIGDVITWGENLATSFGQAAENGITTFATTLQTKFTEVITEVSTWPGRIGDTLAALPQVLTDKATEAGQAFVLWLSTFFTQAQTEASNVPGKVGDAVSGIVPTLTAKAQEAGQAFVRWLADSFGQAVADAAAIPGRIGAAIAGIVGVLVGAATQAGTGFRDTLVRFGNDSITFVKSIPGKIVSAIGDLSGLLVNAGKSVIEGLTRGIKSAYQGLLDFVDGIAAGIAAHKGPLPHDRKVLIPAGLALMDGLLVGMRTGSADVLAFADTIASGVAATTAAAASASFATSPAARTNTALDNLLTAVRAGAAPEVRVFIGDRELTDIVRTEVDVKDAQTATTVRAGGGVSF